MDKPLTHLNEKGEAHMVDVGEKAVTRREAVAEGLLQMQPETLQRITEGSMPKGDVFATARIAGILAAKRTGEWIPLCHTLPLESVEIALEAAPPDMVRITATTRCDSKTGVEMEALTAVSAAALTVYDMCKAVDRGMEIRCVHLVKKTGGKSGVYLRGENK